jgi:hypothetical protein
VVDGPGLLDYSANVIFDANGDGTIRLGPSGEDWEIRFTTIIASSRTNEASLKVYIGQVGDLYLVDSTSSGSTGDTSDTVHTLFDGDAIFYVWDGGDAGATGSVRIRGVKTVPNRGFRVRV